MKKATAKDKKYTSGLTALKLASHSETQNKHLLDCHSSRSTKQKLFAFASHKIGI